ncbi:MAG: anhydro-N-acetylmuramic acid kinase [Gammaproteobacteria bacterium]|nr:anhydro-N-acetylmuramic acid kinase [Gammaproteobacteria bacterium]
MSKMFIGALSGTSMDAIDIAAVDFSEAQPRLLAHANYPIAQDLTARVRSIQSDACRLSEYARLDYIFGKLFADCINDFIKQQNFSPQTVAAIGLHGQTVLHDTSQESPLTLQIADPNVVAYKTGISVVSDFRRADIAAGGQGAPLVPALHALLFAKPDKKQAILNIGGIANVTVLDGKQIVVGFDTGPGNCLMDAWSLKHNNQSYDKNGEWAAAHSPDSALLQAMLKDSFFTKTPPKSTCTGYFSLDWLADYMQESTSLSPGVVVATLAELTAVAVANALQGYIGEGNELLLCGGGAHNRHLVECLRRHTKLTVLSTADKGTDPNWIEAIAFAWLAKLRLENRSGAIPAVTGADVATVLGAVYRTNCETY